MKSDSVVKLVLSGLLQKDEATADQEATAVVSWCGAVETAAGPEKSAEARVGAPKGPPHFVGDADAFKRLFSLPLTRDFAVRDQRIIETRFSLLKRASRAFIDKGARRRDAATVAVHVVGSTLLVEGHDNEPGAGQGARSQPQSDLQQEPDFGSLLRVSGVHSYFRPLSTP